MEKVFFQFQDTGQSDSGILALYFCPSGRKRDTWQVFTYDERCPYGVVSPRTIRKDSRRLRHKDDVCKPLVDVAHRGDFAGHDPFGIRPGDWTGNANDGGGVVVEDKTEDFVERS